MATYWRSFGKDAALVGPRHVRFKSLVCRSAARSETDGGTRVIPASVMRLPSGVARDGFGECQHALRLQHMQVFDQLTVHDRDTVACGACLLPRGHPLARSRDLIGGWTEYVVGNCDLLR